MPLCVECQSTGSYLIEIYILPMFTIVLFYRAWESSQPPGCCQMQTFYSMPWTTHCICQFNVYCSKNCKEIFTKLQMAYSKHSIIFNIYIHLDRWRKRKGSKHNRSPFYWNELTVIPAGTINCVHYKGGMKLHIYSQTSRRSNISICLCISIEFH